MDHSSHLPTVDSHPESEYFCNSATVSNKTNVNVANELIEAADIARIEYKLFEIEALLQKLPIPPMTSFMNSADNLEFITFDEPKPISNPSSQYRQHQHHTELNYRDADSRDSRRKSRMKEIFDKYSEVSRWVKSYKRKINQLDKCRIVTDFSAQPSSVLPLLQFNLTTGLSRTPNPTAAGSSQPPQPSTSSLHATANVSPSTNFFISNLVSSSDTSLIENVDDSSPSMHMKSPFSSPNSLFNLKMSDLNSSAPEYDGDDDYMVEEMDNISLSVLSNSKSPPVSIKDQLNRDWHDPHDSDQHQKPRPFLSTSNVTGKEYSFRGSEILPQLTYEPDTCGARHESSPPTPDLRRAELDCNDISDGIRVLLVINVDQCQQYLRAGVIVRQTTSGDHSSSSANDRMWLVRLDSNHNRHDDSIRISEYQLLEQGVREVAPTSPSQLGPGTRVCASWSHQLPLFLFPGTVAAAVTAIPVNNSNSLSIDFDDGDHRDIDLRQVRLLPENFPNLHEILKPVSDVDHSEKKPSLSGDGASQICQTNRKRCHSSEDIKTTVGKAPPKNRKSNMKNTKIKWTLIRQTDQAVSLPDNSSVPRLVRNIDSTIICADDNVQLLSYCRSVYVAQVVRIIAKKQRDEMNMQCLWYYNLHDIKCNSKLLRQMKKTKLSKFFIFKTGHQDVNDVYSVVRKLRVVSLTQFMAINSEDDSARLPEHTYILAGSYNENSRQLDHIDDDVRQYLSSVTGTSDSQT